MRKSSYAEGAPQYRKEKRGRPNNNKRTPGLNEAVLSPEARETGWSLEILKRSLIGFKPYPEMDGKEVALQIKNPHGEDIYEILGDFATMRDVVVFTGGKKATFAVGYEQDPGEQLMNFYAYLRERLSDIEKKDPGEYKRVTEKVKRTFNTDRFYMTSIRPALLFKGKLLMVGGKPYENGGYNKRVLLCHQRSFFRSFARAVVTPVDEGEPLSEQNSAVGNITDPEKGHALVPDISKTDSRGNTMYIHRVSKKPVKLDKAEILDALMYKGKELYFNEWENLVPTPTRNKVVKCCVKTFSEGFVRYLVKGSVYEEILNAALEKPEKRKYSSKRNTGTDTEATNEAPAGKNKAYDEGPENVLDVPDDFDMSSNGQDSPDDRDLPFDIAPEDKPPEERTYANNEGEVLNEDELERLVQEAQATAGKGTREEERGEDEENQEEEGHEEETGTQEVFDI